MGQNYRSSALVVCKNCQKEPFSVTLNNLKQIITNLSMTNDIQRNLPVVDSLQMLNESILAFTNYKAPILVLKIANFGKWEYNPSRNIVQ